MPSSSRVSASVSAILTACSLLGGLGAACESAPPDYAGDPSAFESRLAPEVVRGPASPGVPSNTPVPQWVVRVVPGSAHAFTRLAVAGDFIYFAAGAAGLYRTRKNGGAIEVVEAGRGSLYNEVAGGGEHVYWLRTTFDSDDRPHVSVRHQLPGAAAISTRFEGDWGTLWSKNAIHFQADDVGVYMNATPRGGRSAGIQNLPAAGGTPIQMLAIADIAEAPTWVVDESDLYYTVCQAMTELCQLAKVSKMGGAPQILSTVPAAYAAVRGVDASDVYLNATGASGRCPNRAAIPRFCIPSVAPWFIRRWRWTKRTCSSSNAAK